MLYGQRRQNVLREITFRTDSYANSFSPDSVGTWNRIGFEVREIISLNVFKKKMLVFVRPQQQSIFGIHDPIGIKRLFQLRLNLSPLRKHKKDHNFKDTGICFCDREPKDAMHFLLDKEICLLILCRI